MKSLKLSLLLLISVVALATEPHKKAVAPKAKKQTVAKAKPVQKAAPAPEMSADDSLLAAYGIKPRHLDPQIGRYMPTNEGGQSSDPYGYATPAAKASERRTNGKRYWKQERPAKLRGVFMFYASRGL